MSTSGDMFQQENFSDTLEDDTDTGHHHINQLKKVIMEHVANNENRK